MNWANEEKTIMWRIQSQTQDCYYAILYNYNQLAGVDGRRSIATASDPCAAHFNLMHFPVRTPFAQL